MVPSSHMQMLYAKAAARNNQCKFVEFPTGMHMDTWLSGGDHYWRTIQQFLDQHVSEKKETESSSNYTGILSSLNHLVLVWQTTSATKLGVK